MPRPADVDPTPLSSPDPLHMTDRELLLHIYHQQQWLNQQVYGLLLAASSIPGFSRIMRKVPQ